ncbi:hypothetical protein TRVA0_016S01684 [Trichomonascus vanleenenianus]|uniref:uncharacterized protein n=1 Tax=Trichomonascus vanleenenianus TaxID=2268995 RepID=UPI003ECB3C51
MVTRGNSDIGTWMIPRIHGTTTTSATTTSATTTNTTTARASTTSATTARATTTSATSNNATSNMQTAPNTGNMGKSDPIGATGSIAGSTGLVNTSNTNSSTAGPTEPTNTAPTESINTTPTYPVNTDSISIEAGFHTGGVCTGPINSTPTELFNTAPTEPAITGSISIKTDFHHTAFLTTPANTCITPAFTASTPRSIDLDDDSYYEELPLPPLEIPSRSKSSLLVPLTPVSRSSSSSHQTQNQWPLTPESKESRESKLNGSKSNGSRTFLARLLHKHSASDKNLYVDPWVHRAPDRLLCKPVQREDAARGPPNKLWYYDPYTQQVFTTANCSLHDVRLAIELNEYFPMMAADVVQSTIEGLMAIDWFQQSANTPLDSVYVTAATSGEPIPRAQYILRKCIAAVFFESARWLIGLCPPPKPLNHNDGDQRAADDECDGGSAPQFAFVDCFRHLDVLGALGEPLWALDQGIQEIYSGPNISVQDQTPIILRWLYIGCCYDPDTSFDALPTLNPHRLVLSDWCFFPIVQRKLAYHAIELPPLPLTTPDWTTAFSHQYPEYSVLDLCRFLDIDVHPVELSRLLDDTTLACDRFAANLSFLNLSSHYPPVVEPSPILIDMRFILA